jgi:hypothetical protein
MSKEAREKHEWSEAVKAKASELAALVAREQYGPNGPPRELTFTEIEAIGHGIGKLAAHTVDSTIQEQHAEHFSQPQPCPQCGKLCESIPQQRALQTIDGETTLSEPSCHCDACKRSFFPTASGSSVERSCL